MNGEWQPIETAPKTGKIIWACDPKRGYESKVVWIGNEWMCVDWKGFGMDVGFYPTHWMPLPDPPLHSSEAIVSAYTKAFVEGWYNQKPQRPRGHW